MKKSKKSIALMVLSLGAMMLSGCGESEPEKEPCPPHSYGDWVITEEPTATKPGAKVKTCTKCGKSVPDTIEELGFERTIVFKDANGTEISNTKVNSRSKIEKPADPTAPEGMVFYGWKNVKNGGQIWNFEDDTLGLAAFDCEFVPVFVPANQQAQYLEAEMFEGIIDWLGVTYSGGQSGVGLIYEDSDYALGSGYHGGAMDYYRDPNTDKWTVGTAPNGVTQKSFDPEADNIGYFVHFNYVKGNTFVFNITSDKEVNDAMIFLRISAEYGPVDSVTNKNTMTFNHTECPLVVNGTAVEYGQISMTNIPASGNTIIPMQDYLVGVNISLKQGANTITFAVDNEKPVYGTIFATMPILDCIKIYTSANLTWDDASYLPVVLKEEAK